MAPTRAATTVKRNKKGLRVQISDSSLSSRLRSGRVETDGYSRITRKRKTKNSQEHGRRSLFKATPHKLVSAAATITTKNSIDYNGCFFQIGDVVAVVDLCDNVYYAQIHGFVIDEYSEKSAVITWLLPTQFSPRPEEAFVPSTYILGPKEELPRKLQYMAFITHLPQDYYKNERNPYPPTDEGKAHKIQGGFIWSSVDDLILIDSKKEK